MQQRPASPSTTSLRTNRRQDAQSPHDLGDLYEARLRAQGLTTNEFLAIRSGAEVQRLPEIPPIKIGRGSDDPRFQSESAHSATESDASPAEASVTLDPNSSL